MEREIEGTPAALIGTAGGSVFVYGISVGSVLSLRAAAALGATMIPLLALCEPAVSLWATKPGRRSARRRSRYAGCSRRASAARPCLPL